MGLLNALFDERTLPQGWDHATCATCGVAFASPVIAARRKDGQGFHCPNGHSLHFIESEEKRLRRQVEEVTRQRNVWIEASRANQEAAKWARADAKRAKTKLRKVTERVNAGVCPHCNRTFQQLARHMACKHS